MSSFAVALETQSNLGLQQHFTHEEIETLLVTGI